MSLFVTVPGGQGVYVDRNTGALGYRQAHSVQMPEGAYATGFKYWQNPESPTQFGSFQFVEGGATELLACPEGEGVWKIFANVVGATLGEECKAFRSPTFQWHGKNAWQYN